MASTCPAHQVVLHVLQRLLLSTILLQSVPLTFTQAAVTSAITPDGTMGTTVTQTRDAYTISGGTITGSNLFHSFGQFRVGTGDRASFTGPPVIANIVSRVTGGGQSVIDGLLQSEIRGANFYLLNPSGVMFGPNASLDVRGSFHVSTADFLRFADGAKFSAHLGHESVLTVASPVAFGFLGPTPAPISIQESVLEVPTGKALSVVGGDIEIIGGAFGLLSAPSGRVQLASVASSGEVRFSPLELAPDFQMNAGTRLGQLTLSQEALLDVSGNGGGTVLMRSGRLLVDHSWMWANTLGDVDGASLGLDLRITGEAVIAQGSELQSSPEASGNGGSIVVNVGRLTLTDGSRISSSSRGAGRGGTLTVAATDAITISGQDHQGNRSGLFSNALNLGDAGQLFIDTPNLTMADGRIEAGTGDGTAGNARGAELQVGRFILSEGAHINTTTFGSGSGGHLRVVATEAVSITGRNSQGEVSGLFSNTFSLGDAGRLFISAPSVSVDGGLVQAVAAADSRGNAGGLEVEAGRLTLTGGAQIDSGTRSIGQGGALTVGATDAIVIAGQDRDGNLSGLFSTSFGSGDAGRLHVSAPTISMDGGQIQVRSFGDGHAGNILLEVGGLTLTGGAQISSSTSEVGRGGTVSITATEAITIAGHDPQGNPSGLFSRTEGSGQGSVLHLAASHLHLSDGGTISASSTGTGDAGTIRLQIGDTFHSENGVVTTEAVRAGGGAIELTTGRLVQLIDSELTTSVRGGDMDAGNITIDPQFVILQGSRIIANAFGGRGGNIGIDAGVFLADPNSRVDASSTLGIQGTVDIRAPVTSLSGALAPLPQAFVDIATMLPARCATRLSEGTYSSLVLGGREGLPLGPDGLLPSPLTLDERLLVDPAGSEAPLEQKSTAKYAFLTLADKAFPQIRGIHLPGGAIATLDRGCPN